MIIEANSFDHRVLNQKLREALANSIKEIELRGVNGQRYIGAGFRSDAKITIDGTPGNDLGAFMDGLRIYVNGNAQDGVGNTMNSGVIVVRGDARDVVGYAMRGGRIFVLGDIGYRVGIHMKAYENNIPIIVIGGTAGDFLGEYMAGGLIIVLNRHNELNPVGHFTGTGMHGGAIFVRGDVPQERLAQEVSSFSLTSEDTSYIGELLEEFKEYFGLEEHYELSEFKKFCPVTHRPYGRLYAY